MIYVKTQNTVRITTIWATPNMFLTFENYKEKNCIGIYILSYKRKHKKHLLSKFRLHILVLTNSMLVVPVEVIQELFSQN